MGDYSLPIDDDRAELEKLKTMLNESYGEHEVRLIGDERVMVLGSGMDYAATAKRMEELVSKIKVEARLEAMKENLIIKCPHRRVGPKIGRNDPCPCGSGIKYKKCCVHRRFK